MSSSSICVAKSGGLAAAAMCESLTWKQKGVFCLIKIVFLPQSTACDPAWKVPQEVTEHGQTYQRTKHWNIQSLSDLEEWELSLGNWLYLDVWKTSTSLSSSLSDWLSSASFWPGLPLRPLEDLSIELPLVSTEAAFLTTCKVMPVMQMTKPSMFITEMSEDWKITANVKESISFTMPECHKNYFHCPPCFDDSNLLRWVWGRMCKTQARILRTPWGKL